MSHNILVSIQGASSAGWLPTARWCPWRGCRRRSHAARPPHASTLTRREMQNRPSCASLPKELHKI